MRKEKWLSGLAKLYRESEGKRRSFSFVIRKSGHAYCNSSLCLISKGSKGWSNQNNAYVEILGAGC